MGTAYLKGTKRLIEYKACHASAYAAAMKSLHSARDASHAAGGQAVTAACDCDAPTAPAPLAAISPSRRGQRAQSAGAGARGTHPANAQGCVQPHTHGSHMAHTWQPLTHGSENMACFVPRVVTGGMDVDMAADSCREFRVCPKRFQREDTRVPCRRARGVVAVTAAPHHPQEVARPPPPSQGLPSIAPLHVTAIQIEASFLVPWLQCMHGEQYLLGPLPAMLSTRHATRI